MKKHHSSRIVVFVLAAVCALSVTYWLGCGKEPSPIASPSTVTSSLSKAGPQVVPGQYIVVLKENVGNIPAVANEMARTHAVGLLQVYGYALKGFAATVPPGRLNGLQADPRVEYVEADQEVTIFAQTLPTGVDRIDAEQNTTPGPVDADIAIIDTGIDLDHPDLNVVQNVTFVSGTSNGDDDHGHGSHVAGTAAAKDDDNGVVGVAPGARLWAVKVLNASGSGSNSQVIAGVDYVTQHATDIEVANMSLGGPNSKALNNAIKNSVAKGVVYAVAAGNSAINASSSSPANSPDVLTVSAIADFNGSCGGGAAYTCRLDVDDTFADFSNFGKVVDIAAPGVCISSTWKNG